MKIKDDSRLKNGILTVFALMLVFSVSAASNQTIEFEAFDGTVNASGDLIAGSEKLSDYSAAVYMFESDSFESVEGFYTERHTSGTNVTLKFNISDTEKRNYGIYFYKTDDNGDQYITYEYTLQLNKTGNNLEGIDSTNYNDKVYFTRKEGAEASIKLDQFDELAAGDPVDIGVNITVDSPIDSTDYTNYVPDSSLGGPNLTEFYQTDVSYTLETYNLTNGGNSLLSDKTESETVSIDFGDYKRLDYTTISETGYYNITGSSDPTVDPKVSSGTTDSDFEEVRYLSRIDSYAEPGEAFTRDDPFQSNLYVRKDTFSDLNEADILEKFEYAWVRDEPFDGENGLDAADSTTNISFDNQDDSLPVNVSKSDEGNWYLCHRAYVEDGRSIITKGKTSCNNYMIDRTPPQISDIRPQDSVVYSESGHSFNATVSDNIQLDEVSLEIDGRQRYEQVSFEDPDGSNEVSKVLNPGAGDYNYNWNARDRVMSELSITPQESSGSITVTELAPGLDLQLRNTTGSSVNEVYWNDTVVLNASTQTMYAPLDLSSNLTEWSAPEGVAGSYTEEINITEIGSFRFEAGAGQNNLNYTEETDSETVKVKEIPTDGRITFLNSTGNEVESAGLMEEITVKADPQALKRNEAVPIEFDSNLSLSEWNNVETNGVYTQEIQMKQEGFFQFNLTVGETGRNSEGFTDSIDSATLTVNTSNGGDENLTWNSSFQNQEVMISEGVEQVFNVEYTGDSSDLTWTVLYSNFSLATGETGLNATVRNSTVLSLGEYRIPLEVYDSRGNYLSGEFNLTVNPDLYWTEDPTNQEITEGKRYSQNFTESIRYIANTSDLSWNMTENRDLFTADKGVIEDTQQLDTGTYNVAFNVTDEKGRKVNASYELTVNPDSSGGSSGGGGGSSSSGGGGGGGSFTIGGTSEESINERIRLNSESSELNLDTENTEEYGIRFEVDEETNITTAVSGNASEVITLPGNFTAMPGNNTIPLTVNRSMPGNYTGVVTLNWNGESVEIPLTLSVREEEETQSQEEFTVAILSNERLTTSDQIGYSVKIWDETEPEISREIQLMTEVEDSEGEMVYRNNRTVNIIDVLVRDFQTGQLEQGTYTVTTTVTHESEDYSGFKDVELGGSDSITGSFNAATGIQGLVQRVVTAFTSLF